MADDPPPSNRPLIYIVVLAILGGILITFFDPTSTAARKYFNWMMNAVQWITIGTYLLISVKYVTDSGLFRDYNPSNKASVLGGEYIGPIGSLIFEFLQTAGYQQLARVLLNGITLNGWNQVLSSTNYLLLTTFALLFLGASLLDVATRANDLRYYWDDVSERIGDE